MYQRPRIKNDKGEIPLKNHILISKPRIVWDVLFSALKESA